MISRLSIVVFITLASYTSLSAQIPGDFNIYLLGGASYRTVKWESYNNFMNSFNKGWENSLSSPISNFYPMLGYGMGVGVRLFVFSLEAKRYGYVEQTRSFIFNNGDRREMQLQLRGWDVNLPIVIPVSKSLGIGMDMQMNIENGELHSRILYDDGTISYGDDSALNGIFKFNNYKSFFIGPRIEVGQRVRAQLSVLWAVANMDTDKVAGIKDLSYQHGGSGNNDATVYFVSDFNQRNNPDYYHRGVDSQSLVQRQVKGLRVEFSVAVDLYRRKLAIPKE